MPRNKAKSAEPVLPPVATEEHGEETVPLCKHHWVIEEAMGPVSWGVCQVCHEGKEFKNSIGSDSWGYFRLGNDPDGNTVSRDGNDREDDPNPDDEDLC